eukprot:3349413-Pyramimonas_sp.AAC.1
MSLLVEGDAPPELPLCGHRLEELPPHGCGADGVEGAVQAAHGDPRRQRRRAPQVVEAVPHQQPHREHGVGVRTHRHRAAERRLRGRARSEGAEGWRVPKGPEGCRVLKVGGCPRLEGPGGWRVPKVGGS